MTDITINYPSYKRSFIYDPNRWYLYTEFKKPGNDRYNWECIKQKPGVYEVRMRPLQEPLDGENERLYIGTSEGSPDENSKTKQSLRERIANLIRESGPHSHKEDIYDYAEMYFKTYQSSIRAAFPKENITSASQLLQIRWAYLDGNLHKYELVLHLLYDPLFPDLKLFPYPESKPFLAQFKKFGERMKEISKQKRTSSHLHEWIETQLNLSPKNAQRYLNLIK